MPDVVLLATTLVRTPRRMSWSVSSPNQRSTWLIHDDPVGVNGSVGGMNPLAVKLASRSGAQVVWLPTVDSANQRQCTALDPARARPPMWAQLQEDLRAEGVAVDPVEVLGSDGQVLKATRQVLQVVPL